MKVLNREELELLHRQGLCEDIRNKLSAPFSLPVMVLRYLTDNKLNEEEKRGLAELIIQNAKISRDCIDHIVATLDHTLSLPDEKIPILVRGTHKKES